VTTILISELNELDGLQERVRRAELSMQRLNRSARAPHSRASTGHRRSVAPRPGRGGSVRSRWPSLGKVRRPAARDHFDGAHRQTVLRTKL